MRSKVNAKTYVGRWQLIMIEEKQRLIKRL